MESIVCRLAVTGTNQDAAAKQSVDGRLVTRTSQAIRIIAHLTAKLSWVWRHIERVINFDQLFFGQCCYGSVIQLPSGADNNSTDQARVLVVSLALQFSIFRRDRSAGYSTRGPVAPQMSLNEARKEISRLKSLYPYQDFVIMGEIGEVTRSERVTVKIRAPDLSTHIRKKRKVKFTENIIPLRKREGD